MFDQLNMSGERVKKKMNSKKEKAWKEGLEQRRKEKGRGRIFDQLNMISFRNWHPTLKYNK